MVSGEGSHANLGEEDVSGLALTVGTPGAVLAIAARRKVEVGRVHCTHGVRSRSYRHLVGVGVGVRVRVKVRVGVRVRVSDRHHTAIVLDERQEQPPVQGEAQTCA